MTVLIPEPGLGVDRLATVASSRSELRSAVAGYSAPHFVHVRIIVGAV